MTILSVGTRSIPGATYTRQGWALYRIVMPSLAGGAMLGASVLPWLLDPLGQAFRAWQLPIDIGWQLHSSMFSYGLLCLCCALYAFFIACLAWGTTRGQCVNNKISLSIRPDITRLRTHYTLAGLLCLMPIGLFFTQYLFIDMGSMAQLAQHEFQAVSIEHHFGYNVAAQLIPIRLDTFDPAALDSRFALLLDQLQPGIYLPFLSTFCLFASRSMVPKRRRESERLFLPDADARTGFMASCVQSCKIEHGGRLTGGASRAATARHDSRLKRRHIWAIIAGFVLLLVALGRGPLALACRFQAEHLLSTGDYADALTWFDRAATLNPSLEQLPTYHIERGQAWYYLHPTQPSMESEAFLADFYLTQDDYLSAYQKLMIARQQNVETSTPSWLLDELSMTLTKLAEMQHPLNGPPVPRANKDLPSIAWLDTLTNINPGNVYAHYTLGRIAYDIHDFTACEKQMLTVIDLSSDPNILSSVYTYLSLSEESEGNYVRARDYLFTAQDYDPSYRNNTAREEMSGLH